MTAAERIRLISEAAKALTERPTHELQLILRQFGFETWEFDSPSGWDSLSTREYCIRQIERGADDSISNLHGYLLDDGASVALPDDGLWSDLPGRVFISHIHQVREFAGNVKQVLASRYAMTAFVAHNDINPSRRWRDSIKSALATCHVFVALLDEGFHKSQWCDQEVGWALARRIPILPVHPVGYDRDNGRNGFLEEHQDVCLDGAGGSTEERWLADKIFESFVSPHPKIADIQVKVIVEAFVRSGSFNSTRRFWKLIENQPVIATEQLRRLEYAVNSNRQVYEAVSTGPSYARIPELVKAVVEKFEPPVVDEEPF